MTLSPTSNVTSPPVGSAVWVGQSRAGSPFSIADRGLEFNAKWPETARFGSFAARRCNGRDVAYALKYHAQTGLRDLMRARQGLEPHVPAFAIFARSARERHVEVEPSRIPGVIRSIAAQLD